MRVFLKFNTLTESGIDYEKKTSANFDFIKLVVWSCYFKLCAVKSRCAERPTGKADCIERQSCSNADTNQFAAKNRLQHKNYCAAAENKSRR